MFASLKN